MTNLRYDPISVGEVEKEGITHSWLENISYDCWSITDWFEIWYFGGTKLFMKLYSIIDLFSRGSEKNLACKVF